MGRLFSIIVYFIIFILSLLFCYLAERYENRKIVFCFFSAIAILLPCLLASLRADTVGTDILVYAKPVFKGALLSSDFWSFSNVWLNFELGYKALAYICAKMTGNFQVFLFATQLLTIVPVYIVGYKRRDKASITMTMLVYLLVFYCATFNLMRQSIAASFLLLACQFYEDKHLIKTYFFAIMAYLFHSSSVLGIALYIVVYIISATRDKTKKVLQFLLITFGITISFSVWGVVLNWLISSGIVPQHYTIYLLAFTDRVGHYFDLTISSYIEAVFRIILAITGFAIGLNIINSRKSDRIYTYVMTYSVCAEICIIVLMFMHSSYGLRLIWCNEFVLLLSFPMMLTNSKHRSIRYWTTSSILIISLLIIYFIVGYIILGWHGVNPLKLIIGGA